MELSQTIHVSQLFQVVMLAKCVLIILEQASSENTIILFFCPPKFCISIVFVFSWRNGSIMVFSEVAY